MELMTDLFLEACRKGFEGGNKWGLMQAIFVCANERVVLPEWAALAYSDAYESCRKGECKSWDDVFDRPYPKGTQHKAINRRMETMWSLFRRVQEIRSANPKTAIDAGLFEEVGKEFGIGKTLAQEFYYEAMRLSKIV